VSATRPSQNGTRRVEPQGRPVGDMTRIRARRRQARRRRRLARIDLGLGLFGALLLLVATPGLAITALIAFVMLTACVASFVVEGRRRRRTEGERPSRVVSSPRSPTRVEAAPFIAEPARPRQRTQR
jgi:Flp pilus assembly protein TadB